MKHCYNCGRITAGDPLFCNRCGRTFDQKLCPRLHVNPRGADICSRCGSRELSSPQPKVPLGLRFLEWLAWMCFGGFFIFLAVLFVYEVLKDLFGRPEVQSGLVLIGLLLVLVAWIWGKLPEWFRKFIRRQVRRRKDRHDEK